MKPFTYLLFILSSDYITRAQKNQWYYYLLHPNIFGFTYQVYIPLFLTDSNFVLGNAQVSPSYPIVYCSDGFCELTGFSRAHVMQKGCACKFLYGPETDHAKRNNIARALEERIELKLEIRLYNKQGRPK